MFWTNRNLSRVLETFMITRLGKQKQPSTHACRFVLGFGHEHGTPVMAEPPSKRCKTTGTRSLSHSEKSLQNDGLWEQKQIKEPPAAVVSLVEERLDDEIVCRIAGFLDILSRLNSLGLVNRKYHELSLSNNSGWDDDCERLWEGKLPEIVNPFRSIQPCVIAYRDSLADSQRKAITLDELCEGKFTFRFKGLAGPQWIENDPWWSGNAAIPVRFENNGIVSGRPNMHWRFITRPMDLPRRPVGSYIRISIQGRDVPTYQVKRDPNNWGFVLESCWGLFANFDLPRKGEATLQDEHLSLTNDVQWREAFLYNIGNRILPEGEEATEVFDNAWRGNRTGGPANFPQPP